VLVVDHFAILFFVNEVGKRDEKQEEGGRG
jgi:hypothetical protein